METYFAKNANVTTSYADVWDKNIVRTLPSTAVVLGVSSSDVDDLDADTGAWTVVINGLDSNYAQISETVTMNGRTKAETTNTFLRVNSAYVATAGTSGTNEGNIWIYDTADSITNGVPDTDSKVFAVISIGDGQTLMGMRTMKLYEPRAIKKIIASIGDTSARYGTLQVQVKSQSGAWQTYLLGGITNQSTTFSFDSNNQIVIPSCGELRIQVLAGDGQANIMYILENA